MIWWQYVCVFFVGLGEFLLIIGAMAIGAGIICGVVWVVVQVILGIWNFIGPLLQNIKIGETFKVISAWVLLAILIVSFFVAFYMVGLERCAEIGWCGF